MKWQVTFGVNGKLTVKDATLEDVGNYSCTVTNVHGSDSISYQVRVQVPPQPPILQITETAHTSLRLAWSTPQNGGSPIKGNDGKSVNREKWVFCFSSHHFHFADADLVMYSKRVVRWLPVVWRMDWAGLRLDFDGSWLNHGHFPSSSPIMESVLLLPFCFVVPSTKLPSFSFQFSSVQ